MSTAAVSFNSLQAATRVISIQDIPYLLTPSSSYHPAFMKGAQNRLQSWTGTNPVYRAALAHAFRRVAARTAWAIVFELDSQPLLVLRNLGSPPTSLTFRRILHVNLGAIVLQPQPNTPNTLNGISGPIQNTLMTEESDPSP